MKKIFIINGNPKSHSFAKTLSETYQQAAQSNHEVRHQSLADMVFNPNLADGYDVIQPLEDALIAFQESIRWADHLVTVSPVWWGGLPAKFKGLFDRSFLPGFAFKYVEGQYRPDQLLKGKSARIIMTMDAPPWYFKYFQGAPAAKLLKNNTLKFSGFNPIKTTFFGPVIDSDEVKRSQWIKEVERLGKEGK